MDNLKLLQDHFREIEAHHDCFKNRDSVPSNPHEIFRQFSENGKYYQGQFSFLFDWLIGDYSYLSSSFGDALGIPYEEMQQISYLELLQEVFDPKDLMVLSAQFVHFQKFLTSLDTLSALNCYGFFEYAVVGRNGMRYKVVEQNAIVKISSDKQILMHGGMGSFYRIPNGEPLPIRGHVMDRRNEVILQRFNEAMTTHRLSERECEIVSLLISGLQNKEIAKKLHLSKYTVETHRKNIMKKLEVSSSAELGQKAYLMGLTG